jgi:SAM-dependent methyltransferase
MDAFDRGARYYELFSNAAGRLDREGPFLMDLLRRCPGKSVADIACGTGLHAQFLAEHGATVHAYDVNRGMIDHARRERPHTTIHYAVHDMREPLDEAFDLVLCLGNSLSLAGSVEEIRRTLTSVRGMLRDGGLFVAQVLNYALPANQTARTRVEERDVDDAQVVAVKCLAPRGNRTYLTLTYFVYSDAGAESVSESAILTHVDRDTLATTADQSGLAIVELFGGFDGQLFDPTRSNDLILVCQRSEMRN